MGNRPRDPTIGCFAASNLCARPFRQVSTTKRNLVAHLPWAHRARLQRLLLMLLTTNVSNKSGNLPFAQSYPEQYENVRFVHSWCTVDGKGFIKTGPDLTAEELHDAHCPSAAGHTCRKQLCRGFLLSEMCTAAM